MNMRLVLFDCETEAIPWDGPLGIKKIWCIVTKELDREPQVWTAVNFKEFLVYAKTVDLWIAHNGIGFDYRVVNNVFGYEVISPAKVIDTFIVSRLINYNRFRTHSLEELGTHLKFPKFKFSDWSNLSPEMIRYCVQDVIVLEAIFKMYKKFIFDSDWSDSMRLEHDIALVNNEMSDTGFLFNVEDAKVLLDQITKRKTKLEDELQRTWPPELQEVNRIQFRMKADGTMFKNVAESYGQYPMVKQIGSELVCYDYVAFKPGSTKDRVEKLWQAGWEPVEKTKTHAKFAREAGVGQMWGKTKLTQELYDAKKEHFAFYGYTVSEVNLLTLPKSAPEGASKLAEWLCLEGRRSSLQEWLNCVCPDGRIHGTFWGIGAWTHRMSHSAPNQANIFAPFHGEVRNAVEQVKADYDEQLRALWCTDKVLVGTDADGIQLRILAHYMQDPEYRDAILVGRKEDETDIHNVNKRALGLDHLIRDDAKTFNTTDVYKLGELREHPSWAILSQAT